MRQDELAAFVAMQSDPTGIVTFERFLWQAKIAVRSWLALLAGGDTVAVVCEHVEDLVVVERARFRFAQLKTRDKGSWSAEKICEDGHAVHRLVLSYLEAEKAGIVARSSFEVWLEGPPSAVKSTRIFFEDPTAASEALKKKIRALGLNATQLTDFLGRLVIRCHQPARPTIDAVNIRLMGAAWPGLTVDQLERIYESLLTLAEAAQSASEAPARLRSILAAGQAAPNADSEWEPIASQALTLTKLRAICPPVPGETDSNLLARASVGAASLLELKLVRAGASSPTVADALLARADADISVTMTRSAGGVTLEREKALERRLLSAAQSIAALAAVGGTALARPAEHIFHTLMSQPANTAALDVDDIYRRDHRLVIGHLCGVSDSCRYGWGLS